VVVEVPEDNIMLQLVEVVEPTAVVVVAAEVEADIPVLDMVLVDRAVVELGVELIMTT
jgi:hypothetical protein